MLHNYQGHSPRWLHNILKVSINNIEPRIYAITDLDYGRLARLVLAYIDTYLITDLPHSNWVESTWNESAQPFLRTSQSEI